MRTVFGQLAARIRFDWGLAGALAVAGQPGTAAVVVDVLSFCTTVSVAADLGVETYPFRWQDSRAAEFARDQRARLAGGRRQGGLSLSPASVRAWATGRSESGPATDRLVLPSPNGATICFELAGRNGSAPDPGRRIQPTEQPGGHGPPVLAGCLRNATAVAGWLARGLATGELSAVAVIAAGEHWPDGTLRPAVEDLWGAGAVLDRLREATGLPLSAEARTAAAAFAAAEPELLAGLRGCASGLELIEGGFADDVAIAAELDAGTTVPLLRQGRFQRA